MDMDNVKEYKIEANKHREKAEKAFAERQKLEKSQGVFDFLTKDGRETRKKIKNLRQQEKGHWQDTDYYNQKAFSAQERVCKQTIKENEKKTQKTPERSEMQVDRDITAEAKRREQTPFGRMSTARQKIENAKNPAEKRELQKEFESYKKSWEKEVNEKISASQGHTHNHDIERER